MKKEILWGILALALLALLTWGVLTFRSEPAAPGTGATSTPSTAQVTTNPDGSAHVELSLGQTASAHDVTLTPTEVVEDSRCPAGTQCVQEGVVRVRAVLESGLGRADQVFVVGEPVTTEAEAVTLIEVRPARTGETDIAPADYRFVFKVEKRVITYVNASSDRIRVTTPGPGAVTGKTFTLRGEARGNWFFEASFPVEVLDQNGNPLVETYAEAQGEWMTTEFVPFESAIQIPASYFGPATIVLRRDNASGLPEHDASISYEITIEY